MDGAESSQKKRDRDEITPGEATSDFGESIETPAKVAKLAETDPSASALHAASPTPTTAKGSETTKGETPASDKAEADSVRKGRTILSFGYLGEGYQGLQAFVLTPATYPSLTCVNTHTCGALHRNPTVKTIEPVLLDAIIKTGAVDPLHATYEELRWDRCARTDKGVSAVANYVSMNIRYGKKPAKSLGAAFRLIADSFHPNWTWLPVKKLPS